MKTRIVETKALSNPVFFSEGKVAGSAAKGLMRKGGLYFKRAITIETRFLNPRLGSPPQTAIYLHMATTAENPNIIGGVVKWVIVKMMALQILNRATNITNPN